MPQIAEARPPYVVFELQAVEDREASIAAGHYVAKDVAYAIVTPAGSKDRIERVAEEWLKQIAEQAQEGRFPSEWVAGYRNKFAEWKAGNEPVLDGTDIRNWPAASPAAVKSLLQAHVRTVEDLAVANEETISRIGMGGRALKAKAVEWLASARDTGKQAEALQALKTENAELRTRNDSLQAQLKDLAAKVDLLAKGAPATPRKL